ncbi:MAG: outer membrane protein assembly factor BamB [Legionellales bacterium]|nr:outer membrane protein assembly factor BamB [Legionellales bacterium]
MNNNFKKIFFISLLTGIALVLFGCSSKKVRKPTPLVEIQETVKLAYKWNRDIGAGTWDRYLRLTPRLYDGILYCADYNGKLKAIDSQNGKVVWSKNHRHLFSSDIGISSKFIMMGTSKGKLFVFDRKSGEYLWEAELSNEVISKPILAKNKIIVKTVDGVVKAFDAQSGKFVWEYKDEKAPQLTMRVGSAPIVKNDKVFVGFASGYVAALSFDTGELLWKKLVTSNMTHILDNLMVDVDIDPKVYHSDLYVAGINSNLMSIDMVSYSVNWQKKVSSYSGLDVDRASVVITDNDGITYLYRRTGGRLVWRQESLKYRGLTSPVIYRGLIFVGDSQGYLHIMSNASGKLLGRVKVHRTGIVAPPIVHNNTVFVKTNNGYITAFDIKK